MATTPQANSSQAKTSNRTDSAANGRAGGRTARRSGSDARSAGDARRAGTSAAAAPARTRAVAPTPRPRAKGDRADRKPAGKQADQSPAAEVQPRQSPSKSKRSRSAALSAAMSSVGTKLQGAGTAVTGAVAEYPVPAALVGAGLAWLLVENQVSRGRGREAMEQARAALGEVSDKVGDAAETVKDALVTGAEAVGDAASTAAESVKQGTTRLGEYVQSGAAAVGSKVRDGAATVGTTVRDGAAAVGSTVRDGAVTIGSTVRDGAVTLGSTVRDGAVAAAEGTRRSVAYGKNELADAWDRHPLAISFAALAAGLAVGLLLPRSRREDDMLGEQSDNLAGRVKEASAALLERGKSVATAAVEAVKREAEGEGLGATEVGRKVKRIASHVKEATVAAAKDGGRNGAANRIGDGAAEEESASRPSRRR